jgi:hypothetical protein
MKLLENLFHPVKSLEKWAIERILKRAVQAIPQIKAKLPQIWEEHHEEIETKVAAVIRQTVLKVVKKALEKQGITILDISNN